MVHVRGPAASALEVPLERPDIYGTDVYSPPRNVRMSESQDFLAKVEVCDESHQLNAFVMSSGVHWCFDGMGVGTGLISERELHSALAEPEAVVDGSLTGDVLMLVHLGGNTRSVIVTTSRSRSIVLANGDGFEVLRIPMTTWPDDWHAPWPRGPVALGRITGFDAQGRVTSSLPFTWCPGSINTFPGAC